MKKSEQIKALQAECDRLAAERDAYRASLARAHAQVRDLDAYRASLAQAHRQVRDLRATLARRDQTVGDRVRSEFDAKWSWLLEAVGL